MSKNRGKTGAYSTEQIQDIYALAKMFLETGHYRRAEKLISGLNCVAPEFSLGWLASALVDVSLGRIERARESALKALRVKPDLSEAMILIVVTSLSLQDYATAGTYLGELRDRIENGEVSDPGIIRLFKMQMVRYTQECN